MKEAEENYLHEAVRSITIPGNYGYIDIWDKQMFATRAQIVNLLKAYK